MSTALERLARELGVSPPPEFAALSPAELTKLADLLAQAREQQSAALQDALEGGLGYLPRLVRGTVKRVLFG